MNSLVVLMLAVTVSQAAVLPYSVVPGATILHAKSYSPAVMKIPKPGIRFNVPQPITYNVPATVTYVASSVVAPPPPAPVVVAAAPPPAPVTYNAPVVVAAAPAPAVVVAANPAPVTYNAPVAVAAAPEPLDAPNPPLPSVGTPFVGGQFHAQDEAGQYTFGHFGGPNTRVETRDSLGRTSGSFAYVDPVGDVQVRKYAAGPASGFKVAASDLP